MGQEREGKKKKVLAGYRASMAPDFPGFVSFCSTFQL